MKKIITKNTEETFEFGKKFAAGLKGGEVIALLGDLGAGKTVFSQGLAKGLGIKKNVNSPTFVIMKVYDVDGVIKKLCHIDAYRLQSEADLEAIGAPEYFNRQDSVVIIEWAERVKKVLPKKAVFIEIKNIDEKKREIKY